MSPNSIPLLTPPAIDIPQVIEIANTNGLKKFLSQTERQNRVNLTLVNYTNGPSWQLIGFSFTGPSDAKQFHLTIDAKTGAVITDLPESLGQNLR